MTMTDGSVPPNTHDVKALLRRPFRLNLPGSSPTTDPAHQADQAGPSSAPADPGSPPRSPAPAATNGAAHNGHTPSVPKAKARPLSTPLVRRPLTHTPGGAPAPSRADAHAKPDAPAKPPAQLSRAQILDATAECLDEAGYDGTTIRMIARRLDCAVGSIYRYFTDKRELLDAVVQQRFEPVIEALEAGDDHETTADLYHQAATTRPEQYRLMFWLAAVGRTPDQPAAVPGVVQRILDGWAEQLGSERDAHCRWAVIHGGIMLGRDLYCD